MSSVDTEVLRRVGFIPCFVAVGKNANLQLRGASVRYDGIRGKFFHKRDELEISTLGELLSLLESIPRFPARESVLRRLREEVGGDGETTGRDI